jgi:hypothetical protein
MTWELHSKFIYEIFVESEIMELMQNLQKSSTEENISAMTLF